MSGKTGDWWIPLGHPLALLVRILRRGHPPKNIPKTYAPSHGLGDLPGIWPLPPVKFGSLIGGLDLKGPKIHDARIAVLCHVHGVRELWSCDRDFSRFRFLKVKNPLGG